MTLSPLSESDSPLHGNGNSYSNPFEISSDDHNISDLNTIIEPDDVDLSSPLAHNSIKAKAVPPKSTAINIDSQPPPVSGSIGQTTTRPFDSNTLDEPVSETLLRDLRNIAIKLQQVLNPKGRSDVLRDWDLWGPLILCLALAILLSVRAPEKQQILVFTGIFIIVWLGSAVVTINAKLLGGTVSFFQSVCILGYCIFPLVLVAFIAAFVENPYVRLPLCIIAFAWSSYASVNFLSTSHLANRRALAVYPLFLFYFIISWLVFISKPSGSE
ncbi:hypothetical protein Glove_74g46 [Diversispora epigaea]|uniref:Protein YIP n=1 Tax=Diversispora epigaea TaxID=1348612 RepID=A0A397J9E4_9GLOM|nr:hypothetical protein Glove_74g46 [Diversispora epigaea]